MSKPEYLIDSPVRQIMLGDPSNGKSQYICMKGSTKLSILKRIINWFKCKRNPTKHSNIRKTIQWEIKN